MSGDYSRWSFDPHRHFGAVLMQQGRVHTDADWNEWVSMALRRVQTGGLDTLGAAVVPRETPDGFRILATGGALTVGPGRMYLDGLLVENHGAAPVEFDPRLAELRGTAATAYDDQPYLPEPPPLPGTPGPHLVYLKAWQRERTAIEEPGLIEPALGVDTTTRLQNAWQVKVLPDVGSGVTCATPLEDVPGFADAEPGAAGRLTTGTAQVDEAPDPCRVPPSGDYKGLENQLYRVEVHAGGGLTGAGRATFKWSRDNATVATRITEIPALDRIVVESVGRDDVLGFSDGDWVEITDDRRELAGLPGEMRRIQAGGGVDDATLTIRLTQGLPAGAFPTDAQGRTTPGRNTRIRRWDQHGRVVNAGGNLIVDLDAAASDGPSRSRPGRPRSCSSTAWSWSSALESGGRFRTGDHWVFAARTADASVEALDAAPPRGIHNHYAKLALVTLPDAETDCRTLWPPEAAEGGCGCTVCVTPDSHASGALTVAAAIQQVKQSGGTVCLGAGEYPLDEPVEIHDARSVTLRGQGLATVLLARRGGEALDVRRSVAVTIEDLSVVTSASDRSDAIRLERSLAATVRRCFVLNLAGEGRGGVAVRLAGFLLGARVEECVLAAGTGIEGGTEEGDDRILATASLRIDDNWLWCGTRGVDLGGLAVHVADTRIAGNTVWGCRDAGVVAVGAVAAGAFDVHGNTFNVVGSGILGGVDALRIADNDVRGGNGDGIVLVHGLDPGGIDHCQVLANRVNGFDGAGIAVRARVASAMVKHNVVAGTGGSGIEVADDGSARVLVVENNQLLDVARAEVPQSPRPPFVAAMRFVGVAELDVAGNVVDRAGAQAVLAAGTAGIFAVATASARIEGNRLVGIGARGRSVGRISAVEVVTPFDAVTLAGNTLRRTSAPADDSEPATWTGVVVADGRREDGGRPRASVVLGDLALVRSGRGAALLTATTARFFASVLPGDVAVRSNEIAAGRTDSRPIRVAAARLCDLSHNRIEGSAETAGPSLVRASRAIASANDLRGPGDTAVVLEVFVDEKSAAVLGNLHNGRIEINGAPLGQAGDPWEPLNPFSAI